MIRRLGAFKQIPITIQRLPLICQSSQRILYEQIHKISSFRQYFPIEMLFPELFSQSWSFNVNI